MMIIGYSIVFVHGALEMSSSLLVLIIYCIQNLKDLPPPVPSLDLSSSLMAIRIQ